MKEVKQAEMDGYAFDSEEEMIGQVCVASEFLTGQVD